jgi:hypothetical protein
MSYLGFTGSQYLFMGRSGQVHGVEVLRHPYIGDAYGVAFKHFYG